MLLDFSAVKGQSPREKLRAFVTGYFDFLASHPNYPRLVQRESMESSRNFGWIVRQYLRPFHNQLVRTIREGITAGEFRSVDPDHTALSILGMITSYFAAAPIFSEIVGHNLLAATDEVERGRCVAPLRPTIHPCRAATILHSRNVSRRLPEHRNGRRHLAAPRGKHPLSIRRVRSFSA